jgi:hypothetical protein
MVHPQISLPMHSSNHDWCTYECNKIMWLIYSYQHLPRTSPTIPPRRSERGSLNVVHKQTSIPKWRLPICWSKKQDDYTMVSKIYIPDKFHLRIGSIFFRKSCAVLWTDGLWIKGWKNVAQSKPGFIGIPPSDPNTFDLARWSGSEECKRMSYHSSTWRHVSCTGKNWPPSFLKTNLVTLFSRCGDSLYAGWRKEIGNTGTHTLWKELIISVESVWCPPYHASYMLASQRWQRNDPWHNKRNLV